MEELLGLASPRDTKNHGGHRALVDMARPGPGSGQSGGPDADLEAGSPDLAAGHRPGLPGTLGRPLISGASASLGTKSYLSYLPMGGLEAQTMGKYFRNHKTLDKPEL